MTLTPEEIINLARITAAECDRALAELEIAREEAIERDYERVNNRPASAPFDLASYRAQRSRAREAFELIAFPEHRRRRRGHAPLSTATVLTFAPRSATP